MQKPTGYDEAKATGIFTPVELGGHYAIIKQVSEKKSITGKDMVVVLFDFDAKDMQAGYFSDSFANDTREEKKWPFNGSKYVMVADYNDSSKTSKQFKSFCTCVEKSNGFQIAWGGANWAAQFRGKKIGVVFGEEEHEWDGKRTMRHVPKWFCEYDKVPSQSIPQPKLLKKVGTEIETDSQGFMDIASAVDEEIPF